MGILADVFVATASDAVEYESLMTNADALATRFERAQYKGLTSLEFCTLWAIVCGEPWQVDVHELEDVDCPSNDGEAWLCRFPNALVEVLAALSPETSASFAEAWSQTDELVMSGVRGPDLQPVLDDLARLSRKALAEHKGLYLWGSL